jgi:adenylate kinase family enzyme
MRRVVILGRGGSGKSTLAVRLGEITGLPVIAKGDRRLPRASAKEIDKRANARVSRATRIFLRGWIGHPK